MTAPENAPATPAVSSPATDNAAQQATAVAPTDSAQATPEGQDAAAPQGAERKARGERGGRNRRGGARRTEGAAPSQDAAAAPSGPRRTHPALEQLAGFYPHLFGAQFLPLKRGVFQDLEQAHPGVIASADLKLALGIHTRSTRYLQAVAQGMPRHDLQGNVVENMAPEHVFQAITEVHRRRKPRDGEDLEAKLVRRMVLAFEVSGLSREDYATLVHSRDEKINALLDQALAEAAAQAAKDEAQLRAFEASGQTLEAFADMYGLPSRQAGQTLERARKRRAAAAAPAASEAVETPDAAETPATPAAE